MVLVHLWLKVRRSQPACDGESTCKLSSTQAKLSPAPIQHMLTPHDEPAHALQARTKEGHLVQGHPCDDFIEHSNSLQCRHLVEQHSMVLPKWSERVRYSAQMLQSTSLPQWERKMAQQPQIPAFCASHFKAGLSARGSSAKKPFGTREPGSSYKQLVKLELETEKPKQTLVAKGIKKLPDFRDCHELTSSSPSSCRRGTTTPPTETDPAGARDLAMDEDRRIHMRLARLKQLGMSLESPVGLVASGFSKCVFF